MMQWPSLDTEIRRGNKQFSGPSRALRRSPVMVWTRQGPSAVGNTDSRLIRETTRATNPKPHLSGHWGLLKEMKTTEVCCGCNTMHIYMHAYTPTYTHTQKHTQ